MIPQSFFAKVNEFLDEVPASIDSWYRTTERNALVKGSEDSAHRYGLAVDLILNRSVSVTNAVNRAIVMNFRGIEYDFGNNHLHLDDHPSGRVWRVVRLQSGKEIPLVTWLRSPFSV